MDEDSLRARTARDLLVRDMQKEATKISPYSEWFKRAVAICTISEYADLIKYRGPTKEVRGQNLLADLIEWADLTPGFTLATVGRTCWPEYQPVVEKRKKKGEYVITLYGKSLADEWAAEDRDW